MNEQVELAPEQRLPPGTRPGVVRLQVADLDRALGFYAGLLGFRSFDAPPGTALLGADSPFLELRERPGANPVGRRAHLGLYHFAVLLPDRASLGRLLAHLVRRSAPLGASDHGVSEALYLSDPDGLGIELYADRPREAWRYRDGELVLTTDPLDASGLTAEGGEGEWAGLPDGTGIGHLHLHVGSLSEARAFYNEALGLDITAWSYPGALFMSAGGYHHHLGVNTWAGRAAGPPADTDAQLLDWTLELPDTAAIDTAVSRIRSHGHEPEPDGDGYVVADPWSTRLRLVAPSSPFASSSDRAAAAS